MVIFEKKLKNDQKLENSKIKNLKKFRKKEWEISYFCHFLNF